VDELKIFNVSKQFPGTLALNNVTSTFESGKVNALIGKNGSGKSTMIKIINGALKPSEGRLFLDDEELEFSSPEDAINKGIATVYQELSLIPGMTVAENLLLDRFPMKGKFIDWKKTYSLASEILESMDIDIDPKEMVYKLNMWQSQMIEIAKAMSSDPKVILLDEPTSSLSRKETEILFKLIRKLKEKNVIIIYISHRLQELWEIADTCTVLRDGVLTGKVDIKNTTPKQILNLMFGEVEINQKPKDLQFGDEVVLCVKNLTQGKRFKNISFDLHKGEVLGIAGMLGSGRTELLRSIFGIDHFDSGTIVLEGKQLKNVNPRTMKELGFAFTPEDRKHEGLIQRMSIKNNLCVASLKRISKGFFVDKKLEESFVNKQIQQLQIKVGDVNDLVSSLSGGNQQKVVVGNWLNNNPKIMMFDEPSKGIDINAKQQIFQIIWELSRQGVSSIVVSSELEELAEICHRILIMKYGELIGEVKSEEVDVEGLYSLCMGEVV